MRYFICFLILFIQTPGICQQQYGKIKLFHGTTIIAFLKDDIGWIVSDTKVVEEIDGKLPRSHQVTKLRRTGNTFYAFAIHPVMYFNDRLVYDAFVIMDSILKKQKDFNSASEAFNSTIIKRLNVAIALMLRNNYHATLEKYCNTSFLGFIMVQYPKGESKPKYQMRSYKFEKRNNGYITIPDPPLILRGRYPSLFLGSYQAAIEFLKQNPKYFSGFIKMRERLICLVAEEIKSNPIYVGYPIDAVEITSSNFKWYRNIKKCTIQ